MSDVEATDAGPRVLRELAARPGGPELLHLAAEREDLMLVGGAVRDILLGREPKELDVTVAEGAGELARALAGAEARASVHERFGTASVVWPLGRIDVAERRAESYAHPGALPDVRPGTLAEDLARRDFTVNALAVSLGGSEQGRLHGVANARQDLAAGRLRVLHELSFRDDPTRLLRLARYQARLGFGVEAETARLAAEAVADGALRTVSGARVGAELSLAAAEGSKPFVALARLDVLAALGLPSPYDEALLENALALLPDDGSRTVLALAVSLRGLQGERASAARQIDAWGIPAGVRDPALAGAFDADALAARIAGAERPSRLRALLAERPLEEIALAGAIAPDARANAERWLRELRHVRLQITGEDLLAAGVPQGPEIGRRLARALTRRLDGALAEGPEPELDAALERDAAP